MTKRLLSAMGFALGFALAVSAWPAAAQDDRAQTLADIRQELTVLLIEIRRLNVELSTTGAPTANVSGSTTLDRVNAIETELQRLTGLTEQLEFRIARIVEDGTRRIADLEFRLVELEGGDLSQLAEMTTLGGDAGAAAVPAVPVPSGGDAGGVQLADQEQADFEAATQALQSGDYETANESFRAFNDTYPSGPLAAAAYLGRGAALEALGQTRAAARAYLEAFRTDQQGAEAPEALLRLGLTLEALGQSDEACVMLNELAVRFPSSGQFETATGESRRLGCG